MRQGTNVFSDCNEKLERSSGGRYHDVVAGVVARLSRRPKMDRIPRPSRTLVPGADRSEWKHKASPGKMARARVVVQLWSIFRSEEDLALGIAWGGSAPFACACLAPHSSLTSRAPPPPTPTLSRLRSWRRWGWREINDGVLSSELKRG
jgi:hypothetical protein